MTAPLYYIHDPMCSWCWGYRPVWQLIKLQLPVKLRVDYLLGGLAPDSDQPMSVDMQNHLKQTWSKIQKSIPGIAFNFSFWDECQPRRSTYPACRAILAAKQQGEVFEEPMIEGVQKAYYLQAQNPSDIDTLMKVAKAVGLDQRKFVGDMKSAELEKAFQNQIDFSRRLFTATGTAGFPSLILRLDDQCIAVPIDYNDAKNTLDFIEQHLT